MLEFNSSLKVTVTRLLLFQKDSILQSTAPPTVRLVHYTTPPYASNVLDKVTR